MKLFESFKISHTLKWGISILFISMQAISMGETPFVHSVISEENGRVFQYYIVYQEVGLKTNSQVMYFWHRNGQLRSTKGGYSGNVLHGDFQEFDKSGRMLGKGTYYYGTKNGEWKTWNRNGEIIRLEKWDKGFLGRRISYDFSKSTIENFKKNQLNGRRIVLNNNHKESVEHFRNGIKITRGRRILKSFLPHKKQKKESDVVTDK